MHGRIRQVTAMHRRVAEVGAMGNYVAHGDILEVGAVKYTTMQLRVMQRRAAKIGAMMRLAAEVLAREILPRLVSPGELCGAVGRNRR